MFESVHFQQLDRVCQRPARHDDLVLALQVAYHCPEHIDMGRIRKIEPDFHWRHLGI
jgi:hypothetical protein